jgi:cytochrome c553
MKKALFLILLAATAAQAEPFAKGDAANGQKLIAKYDCNSCHKGKMGGDGTTIYTRANRVVTSADILIDRMEQCSGAIGKQLSEQEKQDLAAYLNKTYYHFK